MGQRKEGSVPKETGKGEPHYLGKLSIIKYPESEMSNISDNDIEVVRAKYSLLKDRHSEFITIPDLKELKSVSQYLFDPTKGRIEPETWDVISDATLYGYSCYLHEVTEIELREASNARYVYHGGALYRQYSYLKDLIKNIYGNDIDIVELCYNDEWIYGLKNKYNAKRLVKYLKMKRPLEYNRDIHRKSEWKKDLWKRHQ